jgi:aquaporin related protein
MNVQPPADQFIVAPGMHARRSSLGNGNPPRRLPGTAWLPQPIKNHIIGMLGEFVGTFLFLFFAFAATQVANMAAAANPPATRGAVGAPNVSVGLYVALAFGFSLAVNAWVFFRISGGLFNPAVSCFFGPLDDR